MHSRQPWHVLQGCIPCSVSYTQVLECTRLAQLLRFVFQCPQSILSDRLRINGSLARAAIKELHSKGLIRPVVQHSSQQIFTRATGA